MIKYAIFLSAILLTMPSLAFAGSHSAGDSCTADQLGITEMNTSKTGIIGCFLEEAGGSTYLWKSFTGANAANTTQCYTIKYRSPSDITFADTPPTNTSVSSIAYGNKYATNAAVIAAFPLYSFSSGNNAPYSGIKCINDYQRTACTISTGADDNDISSVNNGCVIDNEETAGLTSVAGGGLYITCCK